MKPNLTLQCPCGNFSFRLQQSPHSGNFNVKCCACYHSVATIKGYGIEISKDEREEDTDVSAPE